MSPERIPQHACRLLFENNMDAVFLTVPDGTIIAANSAACEIFGMTETEICAAGRAGLIDLTDPRARVFLEERAAKGKARAELTCKRKDGSTFIGEACSVIVDGGASAFVMVRDITPQKEAEEALRQSEQRFRTLTENNPDIIGRFDRQHRHLYLSPAAERVTERPAQECLGKSARELGMPAGLCERWEACQDRAFAGERATMKFEIMDSNGRVRHLWDMFLPEFAADGSVESVLAISRDITELVEVKNSLQESDQRLRLAQEHASFFSTALQKSSQPFSAGYPDGRLITFNPAFIALLGYGADDLGIATWGVDLTPPEWRAHEARVLEELHRSGSPQVYQKEYWRKDGTRVPVELKVHLAKDPDGDDYYYSFITDITERKRTEEAPREEPHS